MKSRLRVAILVACVPVLAGRYASAWETTVTDGVSGNGFATSVATDPAGDIVAGGQLGYQFGDRTDEGASFAVAKLDGTTGAELWRQTILGTAKRGLVNAVATDAAGDVFAAGILMNEGTAADFAVVKLDGATGAELWRYVVDGTNDNEDPDYFDDVDAAVALATDVHGDVVAAGRLYNAETSSDFAVVKLDGASGSVRWRRDLNGLPNDFEGVPWDRAFAVGVDGQGDVVAAGQLENQVGPNGPYPSGWDFSVVKLAGADGSELWRSGIDIYQSIRSVATALAIDAAGDVVAAGTLDANFGRNVFAVRKLAGGNGAVLWEFVIDRQHPLEGEAFDVALDAEGNAVAVGDAENNGYILVSLAAATGAERWRRANLPGYAHAVAVDAAGEVVTGGGTIARYAGASGAELWRYIHAPWPAFLGDLALDAAGNVAFAGRWNTNGSAFRVLKLFGATGGTFPCGDGVRDAIEGCDDGNLVDGDGCDSNCRPTGCGNGTVGAGEACDDGNLAATDGCGPSCQVEAGWRCTGTRPSECEEICRDGIVTRGEECDDGNDVDEDGCDINCTVTRCGNGILTSGEECDDGNDVDDDFCKSDCTRNFCGDGFVWRFEACDDGNRIDGDGCDNNCTPTGCGNGILTAGEECDDGNLIDRDGCSPTCALQCNPVTTAACRRPFAAARAFQTGRAVYPPKPLANLTALPGHVVLADDDGAHVFDADASSPTFGALAGSFPLPADAGALAAQETTLFVARPGAIDLFDADPAGGNFGAPLGTFTLPTGDQPSALVVSGDAVIAGVPESRAVHLLDGTSGALRATLTPPPGDAGHFGAALATAGGLVFVGSPNACPDASAVHVYDGTSGAFLRSIADPDPTPPPRKCRGQEHAFGHTLAIVGDDLAVSDPSHPGGGVVYLLDVTTGALRTRLLPPPGPSGTFGESIAALGTDVLVGVDHVVADEEYPAENGAAYLFDGTSGELLWPFHNPTFYADANEAFGATIAVVGRNVVIGDPGDESTWTGHWGGAYLFVDTATCGNGVREPFEQCDDGNLVSGDGCDANCTRTACGNALRTSGEECDDGDRIDGDSCDSNCTSTRCGNGIVTSTNYEQCDDANVTDGDGCAGWCQRESGWTCIGQPSECSLCGDGLAAIAKPRLVVRGSELRFTAEIVHPFPDPGLDPSTQGFRMAVDLPTGILLNAVVPIGPPRERHGPGWRRSRGDTHTQWSYRNRRDQGPGVLTHVTIRRLGDGRFHLFAKARVPAMDLGNQLPLGVDVMLAPRDGDLGWCAEAQMPDPALHVTCRWTRASQHLACE